LGSAEATHSRDGPAALPDYPESSEWGDECLQEGSGLYPVDPNYRANRQNVQHRQQSVRQYIQRQLAE